MNHYPYKPQNGLVLYLIKYRIDKALHHIPNACGLIKKVLGSSSNYVKNIRCIFPQAGWFKLNVDDASKGNPGVARCGGVIRDETGYWITGFGHNIGLCTVFTEELSGVLKRLGMAWNRGIRNLVIESDSAAVVTAIQNSIQGAPRNKLLSRILQWKQKEWNICSLIRTGKAIVVLTG